MHAEMSIILQPFQKRFIRGAMAAGIDTAALSMPRGNGKSWLAAYIAAEELKRIEAYEEIALCAASVEQGRIVFRFIRQMLGETGWRYLDSAQRCAITRHDGARLRVIASNGKTAMGLVNTPLVIADEPGAWEVNGGQLLADAILEAQGKPGSPLRAIFIGTLAPAEGGWWHDMVDAGTRGSTYVMAYRGNPEKWNDWREIMRCNPLAKVSPELRAKLKERRAEAEADSRLKARFLSYRLNVPSGDEATMLLAVEDWQRAVARPVAPRRGQPMVGLDLGGGRAWSAAVAIWETGRIEAIALAPGIPDLAEQEKRDRIPKGVYQRLYAEGLLHVDEGRRVQSPELLWRLVLDRWGEPVLTICDRFRLNELVDALGPYVAIEPRVTRWSEAAYDIRALRKGIKDGPLTIAPECAGLLAESLAQSKVENDTSGNMRLIKRHTTMNTGRDDVAASLTLVAGAFARYPAAAEETEERRPVVVG